MKKINLWTLVLLILMISNSAFAFTKELPAFDEIILSGNVSALLIEGTEEEIEIRNDEKRLEFFVDGKSLKVKAKDLIQYEKTPTVKIIITYKKLRSLRVRAGATAYTENSIKGDKLTLRFSSGASGEIEVEQNSVEVSISEGGNLKLSGQTEWQEAKVATGATLSAYKLEAAHTIVKANTGGGAKVVAIESIDARANTGGSISYKGDPKKVQRKDGFSGTIRKL